MDPWLDYLRFAVALFVIATPFEAIPLYLSLLGHRDPKARHGVASAAGLTVFLVLAGTALSGEWVLRLFGVSLWSFMIGGGLVLLLMALAMLNATMSEVRQTSAEVAEAEHRAAIGVVPLGIPLMAGPGAISTVIIEVERSADPLHVAAVIGVVAGVSALIWLCLVLAEPIGRALGQTGLNIVARLFGLLLAAVAIELITTGIRGHFPGLAGSG